MVTTKGHTLLVDLKLEPQLKDIKWTVPPAMGLPMGKYEGETVTLRKLVYYLNTGEWITRDTGMCLYNIDGDQLDCRIANIGLKSRAEMLSKPRMKAQSRSKSGVPGVVWNKANKRWQVYAYENKKQIYLGGDVDLDKAIKIRKEYLGVE